MLCARSCRATPCVEVRGHHLTIYHQHDTLPQQSPGCFWYRRRFNYRHTIVLHCSPFCSARVPVEAPKYILPPYSRDVTTWIFVGACLIIRCRFGSRLSQDRIFFRRCSRTVFLINFSQNLTCELLPPASCTAEVGRTRTKTLMPSSTLCFAAGAGSRRCTMMASSATFLPLRYRIEDGCARRFRRNKPLTEMEIPKKKQQKQNLSVSLCGGIITKMKSFDWLITSFNRIFI